MHISSEHQNYRRKHRSWLIALLQSTHMLQRRKESFICRISFKTEAQICQYILPRMVTQRCCLSEGTARRMIAHSADFLFVRDKIKTLGKCGLLAIKACMLFPELPCDLLHVISYGYFSKGRQRICMATRAIQESEMGIMEQLPTCHRR